MSDSMEVTPDEVLGMFDRLKKEAGASGYYLNKDETFVKELIRGLLINQKRYGYSSCPCRLSEGDKWKDLDIICPCDYRDQDLGEFGACYCALYVSGDVARDEKQFEPVPERRLSPREEQKSSAPEPPAGVMNLSCPVWRCSACGYLCAREQPPELCPICKALRERFERFL